MEEQYVTCELKIAFLSAVYMTFWLKIMRFSFLTKNNGWLNCKFCGYAVV
jgi:hypothetical protein